MGDDKMPERFVKIHFVFSIARDTFFMIFSDGAVSTAKCYKMEFYRVQQAGLSYVGDKLRKKMDRLLSVEVFLFFFFLSHLRCSIEKLFVSLLRLIFGSLNRTDYDF